MVDDTKRSDQPRPLRPELIAVHGGPFFLGALSLLLILLGLLGAMVEAVAITAVVLGGMLAALAALAPRLANVELGKDALKGELRATSEWRVARVSAGSTAEEVLSLPEPEPTAHIGPRTTVAELIASAPTAGWTVGQTAGTGGVTLTKSNTPATARTALGDSLTVIVPTDHLMGPVPPKVLELLTMIGFEPRQPG